MRETIPTRSLQFYRNLVWGKCNSEENDVPVKVLLPEYQKNHVVSMPRMVRYILDNTEFGHRHLKLETHWYGKSTIQSLQISHSVPLAVMRSWLMFNPEDDTVSVCPETGIPIITVSSNDKRKQRIARQIYADIFSDPEDFEYLLNASVVAPFADGDRVMKTLIKTHGITKIINLGVQLASVLRDNMTKRSQCFRSAEIFLEAVKTMEKIVKRTDPDVYRTQIRTLPGFESLPELHQSDEVIDMFLEKAIDDDQVVTEFNISKYVTYMKGIFFASAATTQEIKDNIESYLSF